ncbi:amidase signature domain-containing protein [Suillus lakei]|nr:amidase signature domain-containing protein [Suillus lakei]
MSLIGEYLASDRNPESSYADSDDGDQHRIASPSPVLQESSHDEYTPTKSKKTSSTVYSTPTSRSEYTSSLSPIARSELAKLYNKIYGDRHCLVTETNDADDLQIAHVIPRASKSEILALYEYCLGLNFKTLHVDSRLNLLYLAGSWHNLFDRNRWFLLPDVGTLENVNSHVTAVIASRKSLTSDAVTSFRSKWNLKMKTPYTLISISLTKSFLRETGGQPTTHQYPYPDLSLLECHVAPPFAIINAGPKCKRDQIDQIVLDRYPQQTEGSTMESDAKELKQRLTLLCDTWDLFMDPGVRAAAKTWEKSETGGGKRQREQSDAGQTDGRSTRSKTRSAHGGDRKRKRSPNLSGATLTEYAVSHLEKRQKADNWETGIRHWVAESTRASSIDPNLPLDFTIHEKFRIVIELAGDTTTNPVPSFSETPDLQPTIDEIIWVCPRISSQGFDNTALKYHATPSDDASVKWPSVSYASWYQPASCTKSVPGTPLPDLLYATIDDLQSGLAAGTFTSVDLVKAYVARIDEVNPVLYAVIETNPDALSVAASLDAERASGSSRDNLHGIPICIKDNIATLDKMNNTTGSFALLGAIPPSDFTVAAKLKAAGAIIIGECNLSMGQLTFTMGAYYPMRDPSGSSSGPGVVSSIGFAAAVVGMEISGSIISPASRNSLAGIKPSVRLTSRYLIVPISQTQDTIGPLTRTMMDAAYIPSAIAGAFVSDVSTGKDSHDNYTSAIPFETVPDYAAECNSKCLQSAKIGIPHNAITVSSTNGPKITAFNASIKIFKELGATIVDNADFPDLVGYKNFTGAGYTSDPVVSADFIADIANYFNEMTTNPNGINNLQQLINFTEADTPEGYADHNVASWLGAASLNITMGDANYYTALSVVFLKILGHWTFVRKMHLRLIIWIGSRYQQL